MRKLILKEVREIVKNKGYKLISEIYNGYSDKLIIEDGEGYRYYESLTRLSVRKPVRFHNKNPYSIYNIKLWCKLNNKYFKLLSEKYTSINPLKWQCLKDDCGEIFEAEWGNIYSCNAGCPFCMGRQVCLSNCLATKRPDLVKEWHPILNSDLTPYNLTAKSDSVNIWWQCSENHEHIWSTSIYNRNTRNSGCPFCAGQRATKDNNLLICNPELAIEWNYKKNDKFPEDYCPNSGNKVWWECSKCNHEWEAIINSRAIGNGCPRCNQSKGEKKIDKILLEKNIMHIGQYKFDDCKYKIKLPFDTFLPNYNTCIEYQGRQHYEPVDFAGKGEEWALEQFKVNQIKDQIKRDYCKSNNIKLIEIPYWDFDKIEEILKKELVI